ncbi:MAG: DinB family protein [Dehalococcoidia bacterium]|nr:DinB family protein [Dehalococcoidia bacterium]
MTQQPDPIQRAAGYLRQEGCKSLEELSALMDSAAAAWQRCLEGMSEDEAGFHPPQTTHATTAISGEGPRWCAKEVIGHFLRSERSLNQQIAGMAGLPTPDARVPTVRAMGERSEDDETQPIAELRQRLAEFFGETQSLLSSLQTAGAPDGSFPHPVFGPLTVKEWMVFHRLHSMDHIRQIDALKAAPGYAAS